MHEYLESPENYVKLYTSALLKNKNVTFMEAREFLGQIIDVIG